MFSKFYRSFCKSSYAIIRFTGHYAHQTRCLSKNLHTSAYNFHRQLNYRQNICNTQIKRLNQMYKWMRELRAKQEQDKIWRKGLLDAVLRLEQKQTLLQFNQLGSIQSRRTFKRLE